MASSSQKEGVCFYLLTLLGAWAASTQVGGRKTECPSCGVQDKDVMLELAKQQILQKLHLKERPNITHPIPRGAVVNALRRLHLSKPRMDGLFGSPNWDSNSDNSEVDQQSYEIISFAESESNNESSTILNFQFAREEEQNVHVLQAHLWIFLKPNRTYQTNQTLKLYLVQEEFSQRIMISEKNLEPRWSGWQTFSLKQMLQTFLDGGDKSLKLELDCEGCKDLPVLVNLNDSHQPFLVAQAKVRERSHHAAKRSLKCDQNSNLCCRKDYYVDFKDIGWNDWIIKPEGYQINYCMGLCPVHIAGAPGMAASFHTTVLNLIKANNIQTAVSSCCVPTKRRPLSMLYFDRNNNIVKTDIPDMIVEACGCS
ncbi:inhibin beta B chain-like [Spea bombifrons]|uniref:inhibin beta B chain-like n=1 Tax=Spea bombifrons TaxID=233779 RepID=UPI00234AA2EF|nr:inhibin beta B chain-like [Spea bombifrons]